LLGEVAELGSAVSEGVMSGDTWGAMARFIDYWNGDGAWSRTRMETRAALSHLTGKVAQDFHAVFTDPTPLEACRWLRLPTLVLSGAASPAPARRIAEMLSATLRDARHVALHDAGHMLPLSHGETVAGLIRGHFAEVEAGRQRAA
jgi:pimeloyl-ACP methyl ester carboxylesterase